MTNHVPFMRRCLELACNGRGRVGNGALVGAVLVRDGKIIAEGHHSGFGEAHAERALLNVFRSELKATDTLYVNLEPCSHHGKTAPCTDILIERGVRRVVYGMRDVDARVAGSGIAALRKAGVIVSGPVLPEECAWLNRGYISVRTASRPWITLHRAQTRDGRIAKPDGSPLKITDQTQDHWSHARLRATHDAILVGVGTIIHDDPLLNTRFVQNAPHIYRLILDPHLRIPLTARVLTQLPQATTMIVTSPGAPPEQRAKFAGRQIPCIEVPLNGDAFDLQALWDTLLTPRSGFHGITSLLVEGGPATWRLMEQAQVIDCAVTLVG